jgi:hypothetical protein
MTATICWIAGVNVNKQESKSHSGASCKELLMKYIKQKQSKRS